MSGESDTHIALVQSLSKIVRDWHSRSGNLALYIDDSRVAGQRPLRINGFLPDITAEDVPRTFFVIGEAKTRSDLVSDRSRRQVACFIHHLSLFQEAYFYLAVPILVKPIATQIIRELQVEHESVITRVIPLGVEI